MVDLDAEIAKSEKKLHLAKMSLEKIKKAEAATNYEENVPVDTRMANEERVSHLYQSNEYTYSNVR